MIDSVNYILSTGIPRSRHELTMGKDPRILRSKLKGGCLPICILLHCCSCSALRTLRYIAACYR